MNYLLKNLVGCGEVDSEYSLTTVDPPWRDDVFKCAQSLSGDDSMQQVEMTPSGLQMSRLVAGAWRMAEWRMSVESRLHWINECLANGINTFDHADLYGNYTCEALFGEALAASTIKREQLVLVSKCAIRLQGSTPGAELTAAPLKLYDTSRRHIELSVENSLRNLRTDYLDLLLIHRPDPLMDADGVARTFENLRKAGKVRWFGVSNHSVSQVNLLQSRLDQPLATNQIEISLAHLDAFDDGTLDQCQQLRMRPMAWSPLAGGRLAERTALTDALRGVGAALGASAEQVALAWLLAHPAGIVPVLGTGNTDRIAHAARACDISLSRSQWFHLYAAARGHEVA
jgi:predicted oxidoreductase